MPPRGALLPARFLALTAHLVLLLQRAPPAALPPPLEEEPDQAEEGPGGALGGALGLLGVELVGFFSGVSMFHRGQSLLSLGAHAAAAVTLTLAALEGWDSAALWPLFGLCSVPPAVTEVLLLVSALGCRRGAL